MFKDRKKKKENEDETLPLPKIDNPQPPQPTVLPPPPSIEGAPPPKSTSRPSETPSSSIHTIEPVPTLDPAVLQELESKLRSGPIKETLTKVEPRTPKPKPEKKPRQYTLTKVEPETIPKKVSSFDAKLEKDVLDYIETARKWEESGLLVNAAVSFACAALTTYSLHGPGDAAKMLAGFAKTSHPDVVGHPAFQAAKALLVGVIRKDQTQLLNAVKWLRHVTFQFEEDKEVFRLAIQKTREELA
ncbi:MAG: hypothetical protein ACFFBD_22755 [Candidatus Hodarchaeota archaeon]